MSNIKLLGALVFVLIEEGGRAEQGEASKSIRDSFATAKKKKKLSLETNKE